MRVLALEFHPFAIDWEIVIIDLRGQRWHGTTKWDHSSRTKFRFRFLAMRAGAFSGGYFRPLLNIFFTAEGGFLASAISTADLCAASLP